MMIAHCPKSSIVWVINSTVELDRFEIHENQIEIRFYEINVTIQFNSKVLYISTFLWKKYFAVVYMVKY